MRTILIFLLLTGCAIERDIGTTISNIPTDARNCTTGNCSHNYNSAVYYIADNARRQTIGAGVRGAGDLTESLATVILSPIITLTKPDKKYTSLEDNQ
jgi:hypothetical protein